MKLQPEKHLQALIHLYYIAILTLAKELNPNPPRAIYSTIFGFYNHAFSRIYMRIEKKIQYLF